MKILFVLEHPGVGPLVPALRLLHERGHDDPPRRTAGEVRPLAQRAPGARGRMRADHVHEAPFRGRVEARARGPARARLPPLPGAALPRLAEAARAGGEGRAAAASRASPGSLLRAVERSLPPPATVLRYLRKEQPDLVLVTPLIDLGSRQADWLRGGEAARHPHRLPGLQLGQPDEQGARPRRARPDARLERPPGPRGGGAARRSRPRGSGSRARRSATRGSTGGRAAAARSSAPRSGSTRRSRSSSTCAPPSSSRRTRSSSSRAGSSACARAAGCSRRPAT